jgi:diaminobutyrate-2-oxoglutarate transaminase
MAITRAKGAAVEDVNGNIYIDFFGGAGVMNVGHANPEVLQAAKNQMENLTHSLDIPNASRKALVEALFSILPKELNRVFFRGPTVFSFLLSG